MNGTLGTIETVKEGTLTVRLDNDGRSSPDAVRRVTVTMEHYNHLDYGYAATIHKAQGVTVDRSYVLASKYLDAQSTYVAMSRHRESADLFYGRDAFLTKDDLVKSLSRERTKDVTLDYLNTRDKQKESVTVRRVDRVDEPARVEKELARDESKHQTRAEERLMRQAKLKAFTEAANGVRTSRDVTHDRSESSIGNRNNDLSEFKRQYEARNPELANTLRDELRPVHEKKALSLINEFKRLEEIVDKGGRAQHLAHDHLEKLADKMTRQKDVMQYVREHNPPMEKQVNQLAKEFERGRDLEREL